MSETDKSAAAKAQEKAQELKEAIQKLDFRDRVTFLGSALLVLLFFLPWYRITISLFGQSDSKSWNGLEDAGWVGFIAACLGTVAGLANMGFLPLSGEWKRLAGKTPIQVGLAVAALLLGPIYFMASDDRSGIDPLGMAEAGKTFFFWLALLAALAAAGCAGWKLLDEKKKAGGAAA
jgi:hypothetical protein